MLDAILDRTKSVARLHAWRARLIAFFLPNEGTRVAPEGVTPLSRFELRLLSAFRFTVLACVALLGLMVMKSWLFPAENLALGKPVKASSKAYGTEPSGAVDGNRYGQLGFHSRNQDSAWLVVDLGGEAHLSQLKIFGRAECCHEQSLPIALEVSSDGSKYERIGERTRAFGQYQPWVVTPKAPTSARFVRLRTLRKTVLVLSEIEVYGSVLPGSVIRQSSSASPRAHNRPRRH